jgi:hypothetical protein
MTLARRDGPRFRAYGPRPVGPLECFFDEVRDLAGAGGCVLAGFDFPIGLPQAYARRAGLRHFPTDLLRLGNGRWQSFYEPARTAGEISPQRPFYPDQGNRAGPFRQAHLVEALGVGSFADLLRRCDRKTPQRPRAQAIFWTLGPSQVGKAAISGWRDLLVPALRDGRDIALWPFDGALQDLFAPGRIVVAETYPRECYGHLDIALAGRKGDRQVRRSASRPILTAARRLGLSLDPDFAREIEDGFGAAGDGEDRFDSAVGLLAMLQIVLGWRAAGAPDDPVVRRIEGWILGQMP